jgi:hypothetical protein
MHALVNVPVRLLGTLTEHLERSYRCSPRAVEYSYGQFGMHTLPMQIGAFQYLCKRLDHRAFVYFGFQSVNVADYLGFEHRGTDGFVSAKRAGWTENIGIAARRRAGWQEIRHLDHLALALHKEHANAILRGRIAGLKNRQVSQELSENLSEAIG